MAEKLTLQQQMAVSNRGGKLLVSAAAGSGKTKVLVDRLLSYITQPGSQVNLDDFLVITYTKAAAAELRGKIAAKLHERIALAPQNKHLQMQARRLYLAKISTVHAFCGDILREYAYRLDIPADFRIADEREAQQLQIQVVEKLLDGAYDGAEENLPFQVFADTQQTGRDDRLLAQIILQVYNSARCHLDPDMWLTDCLKACCAEQFTDISQTLWGHYLIDNFHSYLSLQIAAMKKCAALALASGDMPKPAALLQDTVLQLEHLLAVNTWDDICQRKNLDFGRLTFPKSCENTELMEQIKAVRSACKSGLEKRLILFSDNSERLLCDLSATAMATQGLISMVQAFSREYDRIKRARHILDFGDLEHKMLRLLYGKELNIPTQLAQEIGSRFTEIMVDEYQDSNAVQDAIFAALTAKNQNCFMVGDVKQSIYQFRLADPSIFLEKYNTYLSADDAHDRQGRKVLLSSNFRSGAGVIEAVNDVFSTCMSQAVGGLTYGADEILREGIPHIPLNEPEIELAVVDVQQDTYREEADWVASRILTLLDGSHYVRNGDTLRPIVCEDIVILLRSPNSVGYDFQYALESKGVAVNFGSGTDLLQTEEVSILRSLLQIISNPMQDIPLLAVLSSRIFRFTGDELAQIRAGNRKTSFYEALKASAHPKATDFLALLDELRQNAKLLPLSQLIDYIFSLTKMDSLYSAFPGGAVKKANLQSFCQLAQQCEGTNQKELSQFLDYLDALSVKGIQGAQSQQSNAVTIMSIHKSKGLEFPVVFLCGLSRDFNQEDARAQVLCHRELGLGLSFTDQENRVRYPTIAKRAISARILADNLSEEMRVLYVAMTRARDRLVMSYAVKNPEDDIGSLAARMDICGTELLVKEAQCPGEWVLLTAISRAEAGQLHTRCGRPQNLCIKDTPWDVRIVKAPGQVEAAAHLDIKRTGENTVFVDKIAQTLSYCYPYISATQIPSKQTATQLKGRQKDGEAAEDTVQKTYRDWRKPSFAGGKESPAAYGTVVHSIMQYLRLDRCTDAESIKEEMSRLVSQELLVQTQIDMVDEGMLWRFFSSQLGQKLRSAINVIREFKFSILDDAANYTTGAEGDRVLLQGVVDCAIIEDDGIEIIDFKTDRVTEDSVQSVAEGYRQQVTAYAQALSRIYKKPVKGAYLYFFHIGKEIMI